MNDFQTEQSRLALRGYKRKQNRLLNLLIAIVLILILIVVISIVYKSSGGGGSTQPTSGQSAEGGDGNGSGAAVTDHSDQKKHDDQTNGSDSTDKQDKDGPSDESKEDQQSHTDDEAKEDDGKKDDLKGGGPKGPWEAVGTKQKGEHVSSSYDKGSTDWNEKIQALLYATGIDGEYTLWHLGNGGSPQKSTGIISSKKNPGKKYVVQLKWVKDKGWKPTSVRVK